MEESNMPATSALGPPSHPPAAKHGTCNSAALRSCVQTRKTAAWWRKTPPANNSLRPRPELIFAQYFKHQLPV
jgi:hypothetical protein